MKKFYFDIFAIAFRMSRTCLSFKNEFICVVFLNLFGDWTKITVNSECATKLGSNDVLSVRNNVYTAFKEKLQFKPSAVYSVWAGIRENPKETVRADFGPGRANGTIGSGPHWWRGTHYLQTPPATPLSAHTLAYARIEFFFKSAIFFQHKYISGS